MAVLCPSCLGAGARIVERAHGATADCTQPFERTVGQRPAPKGWPGLYVFSVMVTCSHCNGRGMLPDALRAVA